MLEEGLKRINPSYLLLGGIAFFVVVLDQISKALVRANIPLNGVWSPWDWLLPYARLFHIENTGVAFGMFQGANTILAVLAVLVSAAIIYYYPRVPQDDIVLRIALGMQLGGALGNLVDRIVFGRVTDFLSVGTFAVFNLADSSITVGVLILLLSVWLQDHKKTAESALDANPPPAVGESGSSEEAKE
jgi:signal peptidase II